MLAVAVLFALCKLHPNRETIISIKTSFFTAQFVVFTSIIEHKINNRLLLILEYI